jgi:DNA polymerase-3 subunit alpha (Gram-positive type)
MKYVSYIVLDFETGGFNPLVNPITQVAVVLIDGFTLQKKEIYSNYVKPYDINLKYEQSALDYTHITMNSLIEKGVELKKICLDIESILKKSLICSGEKYLSLLVGQNITFDIPFLLDICKRTNVNLSKYLGNIYKKENSKDYYPQYFDTLSLSLLKFGNDEKVTTLNLGTICQLNEIELSEAHNARYDTIATADVFIKYAKQLRNNKIETIDNKSEKIRYTFPI